MVATGQPPLRYQWRKNGTNIPGANNPGYKAPPATGQDNGAAFSVIVSDDLGSVTSRDAILTRALRVSRSLVGLLRLTSGVCADCLKQTPPPKISQVAAA